MAADTVHRTDRIIVHTHTVADATVNSVHCLLLFFPFHFAVALEQLDMLPLTFEVINDCSGNTRSTKYVMTNSLINYFM